MPSPETRKHDAKSKLKIEIMCIRASNRPLEPIQSSTSVGIPKSKKKFNIGLHCVKTGALMDLLYFIIYIRLGLSEYSNKRRLKRL